MRRERATALVEEVIRNAVQSEWPVSMVAELYVFGSYARGALQPADVDVAVALRRDERWGTHFVNCLSVGNDPFVVLRIALRGRRRNVSLVFDPTQGYDDIPMTLLWTRGEPVDLAMERLHDIPADPTAGRAPRDAMLPCFEGLEDQLPRYLRQELVALENAKTITLEQVVLDDAEVADWWVQDQIDERWVHSSPLRRAAHASLAYLRDRSVGLRHVHLHGRDLDKPLTPHFIGFNMRYFRAAMSCFEDHGGVEWLEIAAPARRGPLVALQVGLVDRKRLADRPRGSASFFG